MANKRVTIACVKKVLAKEEFEINLPMDR